MDKRQYVVNLLANYKALYARRINLNLKLTYIQKLKNNAIEAQFLSSHRLTDMPGTPRDGLKESTLLLIKDIEYKNLSDEESFLHEELLDVDLILESVNASLNSLRNEHKDIVYFFYVEKYSWIKVCKIVNYSDRQCQRARDKAIEYLYKSLEPLKDIIKIISPR